MRRGFTLIELIVVIIIIGVLAAVALPQYMRVTEAARQAEGVATLGEIRKAQKRYYTKNTKYATTNNDLDVTFDKNRYFTSWLVFGGTDSRVCIGGVERNTLEKIAGFGNYDLYIYEDGAISYANNDKTDTAPSATRPGL